MEVAEYPSPSSLKSSPSSLLPRHPFPLTSSVSHPSASSTAAAPSPGDSVADRDVAGELGSASASGGSCGAWRSGLSSGIDEGEGVLVAGVPDQGGVAESERGTLSSGHVEVWGEGGSGLRDVFGIIVSGGSAGEVEGKRRRSCVCLVACMAARVASECPTSGKRAKRLADSRRGRWGKVMQCDRVALGPLVSRERRQREET